MNPVNTPKDMTPDQAAASLALATRLQEGMMPKAQETHENADLSEDDSKVEQDIPQEENEPENEDFQGKVLDTLSSIQDEIKALKK